MAAKIKNSKKSQTTNGNGPDGIRQVFVDFAKELWDNEINDARIEYEQLEKEGEQKEGAKAVKYDDWRDAVKMYEEYVAIKEQISIKLEQSTEEFVGNIDAANAYFGELGEHLDNSIACIKETQQKFLAIITAINELENAFKDHCNTGEAEMLENEVGLSSHLQIIKECANESCDEAGKNFDEAVKAAGMKALLKMDSIVTFGADLTTHVTTFKSDVDAQLAATFEGMSAKRELVDTAIQELCTAKDDFATQSNKLSGLQYLERFVMQPSRRRPSTMDHLLVEAEKNFLSQKDDQ